MALNSDKNCTTGDLCLHAQSSEVLQLEQSSCPMATSQIIPQGDCGGNEAPVGAPPVASPPMKNTAFTS